MQLPEEEIKKEKKYLKDTISLINDKISSLGQQMYDQEEKIMEFKKYAWKSRNELDPAEMKQVIGENDLNVSVLMSDAKYFRKLYKIQRNPYFGSIIFEDEDKDNIDVYIGMTYLTDENNNNVIYDWRSPICSLFYDYEPGKCEYKAPDGVIKGNLLRKRQYKIQDGKLKRVFDNNVNIDDELLQEVLASESSEKMKNIVNTIQQEQNSVIRNTTDKTLIVQGIAGSGKTSVALHRIAFLLYKIEKLTSDDVLIFSPNQIFTEYISNVLPELGEENTLQTTFHDYLSKQLEEYENVESFVDFIARYYSYKIDNVELVAYKQSDKIIPDIVKYIQDISKKAKFKSPIVEKNNTYSIEALNDMLHDRYSKLPLFERISEMALKLSEINTKGKDTKTTTYANKLYKSLTLKKDYKEIYKNFFKSEFCKIKLVDAEIDEFVSREEVYYEDALLIVFIKGLMESFPYEGNIRQIIVDEAQDYSKLQYIILSKIFKKASFTILGDINQTINPYYQYASLEDLKEIFKDNSKYIELNKTYRSSPEIIDFTNHILGLHHVSAIRRENNNPVKVRKELEDPIKVLNKDIKYLQSKYKGSAIITKDSKEAEKLYKALKDDNKIKLITNKSKSFSKELIVLPAYIAKGLEFDSVIVYNSSDNKYRHNEKNLLYVACTRAQHELIIYN